MYSLARIVAGDGEGGQDGLLAALEGLLREWAAGANEAQAKALALIAAADGLRRAEAAGVARAPGPQPLGRLMDRVEARWRDRAAQAEATLLVSFQGDSELVALVDLERFDETVDALMAHALAGPAGAIVETSLAARREPTGVTVELSVRDNRAGRDEAYARALMAGEAPIGKAGGVEAALGLGLAQRIAATMGGALEAAANAGPGSTLRFKALIPLEAAAPGPPPHKGGLRGHVLIVDDNATNRLVVEALCEMFGFSAECVVDGVEAVAAARVGRFDAILMDIRMPRLDGIAATGEIRALPGAAGATPIIALTANADPQEARAYRSAGMQGVVEKPVKPEALLAALEAAMAPGSASDRAAA